MFSQIRIFDSHEELSVSAADEIVRLVKEGIVTKNKYNLGLAAGSSPKKTYEHIIQHLSGEALDLTNLHTFNLDEYYPIKREDPHSFYQEMVKVFWQPLHMVNTTFDISHGFILNGEATEADGECKQYEHLIKKSGGIDLQIVGLGVNGHIAFNEPGSAADSRTRKIEIAEGTRQANMKSFAGDEANMPQFGLTMGIGTILESKKIFLIVSGESKRPIYEKLLQIPEPSPSIPASFLLQHPDVTVFTELR